MNQSSGIWLYRFAKTTVLAGFLLILIGSLVTTEGAGMAFGDWPLSDSSLNPAGWWSNLFERLEHGHRLFAELTGGLIGILCAWTWGNRWAVPSAFAASGLLSLLAFFVGFPPPWIAHVGLWSAVLVFAGMLFWQWNPPSEGVLHRASSSLTRWLSFAAFIGVVVQAILGGLRVTIESGGNSHGAMILRILHGAMAQVELCLLVAITVTLSPRWQQRCRGGCVSRLPSSGEMGSEAHSAETLDKKQALATSAAGGQAADTAASAPTLLAWVTFVVVLLQLLGGATMRHLGVGLIIPTFPQASPDGSWLPGVHNSYVDINFAHTRLGALLIGICGVILFMQILRSASPASELRGPAWLLLGLIIFQMILGITILSSHRAILPTTLHVINGAAILATSLVLAMLSTQVEPTKKPASRPRKLLFGFFHPHRSLPGTAS